jgi:hypothetical protein
MVPKGKGDPESHWNKGGYAYRWFTKDEIHFVEELGTWSEKKKATLVSEKIDLLKSYLAAMPLRAHWGEVNPVLVEHRVRNLISSYEILSRPKGRNA